MKDPLEYVRPNILALEPYSTARDECKADDISVWIDANENPFDNGVNRYPDPHQKDLKNVVARLKGVRSEQLFIGGAGSDEAIDLAFRIFCRPGVDNAITFTPTYGVYGVSAATNDVKLRTVPLGEDFSLPKDELLKAADSNSKLMLICSPNNPTGNAFGHDELLYLAERFDGMLVVDEAYVDFSEKGSMVGEIVSHPNIIVLQTFSKAWGMAGMRLGMAIADERVAELFARVKYPYNVNGPTQTAAIKRIGSTDVKAMVEEILEEREKLSEALAASRNVLRVYPSDANFLLIKVEDACGMYDFLVRNGVMVRNRSSLPGCSNTLRITVGTSGENERVIRLVNEYTLSALESSEKSIPTSETGYAVGCGIASCGQMADKELPKAESRMAETCRKTAETDIRIAVNLDGSGSASKIDTGLKFFDHMLYQIPHHAGITLNLTCHGDLEVDEHHTMEDVAIVLGETLLKALGDRRGIERYGFVLPMDESSAMCLLDLGGRSELVWDVPFTREYVGDTPTEMYEHFFKSLSSALKANINIKAHGENNHHIIEAVFKAFARALRMAVRRDPASNELPSSKGVL